VWDGDDFQGLYTIDTAPRRETIWNLIVYEEPMGGRVRLVSG
jgi:hypothetical protein